MIRLSKSIAPFFRCSIGQSSTSGKLSDPGVVVLVIPKALILQAFLIRIHQKFIYASELRHFLLTHPLLILELGFHLVLDPSTPYGFDCEQTLPSRFWLSQKLRDLDQDLLQSLLHATVAAKPR